MSIRKNPKLCDYSVCKNNCVYNLDIQWVSGNRRSYNLCYQHIQEVFDVNQYLIKTGLCNFIQGPPK